MTKTMIKVLGGGLIKILSPFVLVILMILGSVAIDALLCWEAYELVLSQFFYIQPTAYYFWLGIMMVVYVVKRVLIPGKEDTGTNVDLTNTESIMKGLVLIFNRVLNYAIVALAIWIVSII